MILTGKAKEDFLSWYGTGEHYFTTTLEPIEQYANIIGWLDEVEIFTNVVPIIYENKQSNKVRAFDSVVNHQVRGVWKTRSEATIDIIIISNEIYNNKA